MDTFTLHKTTLVMVATFAKGCNLSSRITLIHQESQLFLIDSSLWVYPLGLAQPNISDKYNIH